MNPTTKSPSTFALVGRILANDLRLYFRAWQRKGRSIVTTLVIQAVIIGFLHLQMPVIFAQFSRVGGSLGGAGLACSFIILFTLMAGFHRSVEVLYNRGDLPYLLSSPVPTRIVILTRLADILGTTALTTLFMVMPMLNCAVYVYGPHWFWGWPAWLMGVATLAPLALLATILLVKWIGSRAARTMVQILGIVVGMVAIVAMQAPNWLRHLSTRPGYENLIRDYFAVFETRPLPQLVAAASGEWPWLLALAAAGGLSTILALRGLEREFVSGAQSAAADSGGGSSSRAHDASSITRAWGRAFRRSRWSVLLRKELRTLLRDPLLLARSSTQLISFLPALVGFVFLPKVAALGMLAMVAPAMTSISTAALMSANDEALEMLCASPVSRVQAMWARTFAAAIPSMLVGWACALTIFILGAPYVASAAAVGTVIITLAHAWLGGCTAPRQTADDRAANRQVRTTWQVFVSMLVSGLAAGAIAAPQMGAPVIIAIPLAALALVGSGLMFVARPRPVWLE